MLYEYDGKIDRSLFSIIAFVMLFLCPMPSLVADQTPSSTDGTKVVVELEPRKTIYHVSEPISFYVRLRNEGSGSVTIFKHILPEGWLLRITIRDKSGREVYGSPVTKVTPKRPFSDRDYISLDPGYFWGSELRLEGVAGSGVIGELLPVGEYVAQVVYTNVKFQDTKDRNALTGTLTSDPVTIAILP
jgi:hypothetical protein